MFPCRHSYPPFLFHLSKNKLKAFIHLNFCSIFSLSEKLSHYQGYVSPALFFSSLAYSPSLLYLPKAVTLKYFEMSNMMDSEIKKSSLNQRPKGFDRSAPLRWRDTGTLQALCWWRDMLDILNFRWAFKKSTVLLKLWPTRSLLVFLQQHEAKAVAV